MLLKEYEQLLFFTAGSPISTKKSGIINGLNELKNLDLDGMELEFVRGVWMKKDLAEAVNSERKKLNLRLTAHAPYFINLNSHEPKKVRESIERILSTARIAKIAGADSFTFHAGYYLNDDKVVVYVRIKEALSKISDELKKEGIEIWIRPELTGKDSQFGNISELIRISREVENVLPCIDFAHYYARSVGRYKSYEDFVTLLKELKSGLGNRILSNMHMHFSGIEFGKKGERKHLMLKDSEFDYKALLKALRDFNVKGVLVSESPNIEKDALFMKSLYYENK